MQTIRNKGVHWSKPEPDRPEPVGPEDRNFEYSKTGDRSNPGLIRFPLGPVRVLDRLDRK